MGGNHRRRKTATSERSFGKLHRIDRDFDVHAAFELATALTIIKLLGGFYDDHVAAVVFQPIDQRADRRAFRIFNDRSRDAEGSARPGYQPRAPKGIGRTSR